MEIHSTEMSQGENDYEKDLQQLYSTVAGKIDEGTQKAESFFSSACIYRVPEKLRKLKESAYTPHLIAIGPLHREDEHLQTPLQLVKLSYTNYLLSRLTPRMEDQQELTAGMEEELAKQKKLTVLQECLAELKTLVDNAKKCYAEEVTLDEEMMLVDGCFILEFLYRSFHGPPKGQETDPIFGNPLTVYHVENDLVLLENQIPFFVLEKLFQLTVHWIPNRPGENCSLIDYVRQCYCDKIMSPVGKSANAKTRCSPSDTVLTLCGSTAAAAEEEEVRSGNNDDHRTTANYYYHILHNLHDGCLRLLQSEPRNLKSDAVHMPSALDLNYAGVKFVPNVSGSHLFNFTEPKGLFWMWCWAHFVVPPLEILDYTELYLRNLIAFEQCCPGILQNVTSYAYVMSMLVNTDKDVQVLEKAGVMINHFFARKDATNLLTSLCKETALRELIFADACIDAIRYSKRCWSKNMAACRYFVAPWTFSAFVVGFISFAIHVFDFVRKFLNKEKVV